MPPIVYSEAIDTSNVFSWVIFIGLCIAMGLVFSVLTLRNVSNHRYEGDGFGAIVVLAAILLVFVVFPGAIISSVHNSIANNAAGWKELVRTQVVLPRHALEMNQFEEYNLYLRPVSDAAIARANQMPTGEHERLSFFPDGMKVVSIKKEKGRPVSVFLTPIIDNSAHDELIYAVSAKDLSATEFELSYARNLMALKEIGSTQTRDFHPVPVVHMTQEERDKKDFEASQAR